MSENTTTPKPEASKSPKDGSDLSCCDLLALDLKALQINPTKRMASLFEKMIDSGQLENGIVSLCQKSPAQILMYRGIGLTTVKELERELNRVSLGINIKVSRLADIDEKISELQKSKENCIRGFVLG